MTPGFLTIRPGPSIFSPAAAIPPPRKSEMTMPETEPRPLTLEYLESRVADLTGQVQHSVHSIAAAGRAGAKTRPPGWRS